MPSLTNNRPQVIISILNIKYMLNKFSRTSWLILGIIGILLAMVAGGVNYYITYKRLNQSTYTNSVILFMPNFNEQTTFILSNKPNKEWMTLADAQSSVSAAELKNPEIFNVKYSPDPGAYLVNYYNLASSQKKILEAIGVSGTFSTDKPLYNARSIGNGYIYIDYTSTNPEQTKQFSDQVGKFQKDVINNFNVVRPLKEQVVVNTFIEANYMENKPKTAPALLALFSAFLVTAAIWFYSCLFIKNKYKSIKA
jgi:hypothetical protein